MRQDEAQGAGTTFADFVAGTVWADVAAQSHEAKRSILNFFATALGSANDPAVTAALRTLSPFSGAATSAVIGRPERLDALAASFVNAISANLLDFDDTHLDTIIHPAAPVAAPVLASAQARGYSGRAVLTAFILGVEVECRIGNAVSPGHYARGWHITSTCGVFGAAAACAKLLGLPADQISNAIGIAASQSAGIIENLPSAAKNVSVGNAARNGLFAALLAAEGYSASPRAIEGPLGWARAMGNEPDIGRLTGGLGKSWEIAKNTYKPYPAGIVFHAVIDACFTLRTKLGGRIDDIASITVQGSALLLARGDRPVRNERDARVSIHHCAACALLLGMAGVTEFTDATVFRPDIVSLRQKVKAELDASLPDGAGRVIVRLMSGETLSEIVMEAKGSLADPLSDRDIEAKLRDCARLGRTDWDIDRVIDGVWRLDELADVSSLMRAHG
ncbi:MmgE/PrpD family protein [Bradyrhizobium sp. JYMT SZCCT0180]|uniref:MmgE/PrpD family protein n=1 Tax=Bradyrhizobium sp. JYMT SZCCT0180 TaxID=2807666 RepID=UPI001BAB4B3C|nr:MmgE/PrpD family protein [Bradyrhizobium sp. JYMT SZCCT0180]